MVLPAWWCDLYAAAYSNRDAPERAECFAKFLDSPRRVILEIVPQQRIGFDGAKTRTAEEASAAHAAERDLLLGLEIPKRQLVLSTRWLQ